MVGRQICVALVGLSTLSVATPGAVAPGVVLPGEAGEGSIELVFGPEGGLAGGLYVVEGLDTCTTVTCTVRFTPAQ